MDLHASFANLFASSDMMHGNDFEPFAEVFIYLLKIAPGNDRLKCWDAYRKRIQHSRSDKKMAVLSSMLAGPTRIWPKHTMLWIDMSLCELLKSARAMSLKPPDDSASPETLVTPSVDKCWDFPFGLPEQPITSRN
jgi:hypothetical protein